EIGYGGGKTYQEIAGQLGNPNALRAVGAALHANPLPIVVPCHRVLSKKGLGGFNQGWQWKRKLLELEGVL
ncbi:MAG: methylated-DNA--[protein]-cysteine S-methyltransferase, partial [Candidatus Altiarchaeales archaeon]|nr:methylated-DNA--[protein]-cysteine S-methyltransferase [Candidatus Altiarchaeales archaeon]